jgi:hypothetical protein
MEADSDPASDNHPEHDPGNDEEYGVVPFDRMAFPRPAPDTHPKITPWQRVWCYDQPAKGRRGKPRRYRGIVKRVGGPEGERLRRELAATIHELLLWAQQQSETETKSDEDGGNR